MPCLLVSGEPIQGRSRFHDGNETSGLLLVELNNEWGTVCGNDFTHYDAHVACREMGFGTTSGFTMKTYVRLVTNNYGNNYTRACNLWSLVHLHVG